jgi:hypothetical protein
VSESTDPDLRDLMEEAAAVVTEAGGLASHAAILCREMAKPAIVGVEGLLSVIKNGDFVVVNADEGYINIVRWDGRQWTLDGTDIKPSDAGRVGAKASNLSRMLKADFRVPRFFVIPTDRIEKELSSIVRDASGPQWDSIRAELRSALEYLSGDLFMLRSSTIDEDLSDKSHAGEYESQAHVERQELVTRVLQQVVANLSAPQVTRGATIVQEMILGDYSGVCMTRHPLTDRPEMLVELVPGGNDTLTSGKVVPIRYVVDRETHQVVLDQRDATWSSVVAPQMWEQLIRTWLEVERLFGAPQDIEWTAKGRDIWLLQSRPITSASTSNYSHRYLAVADLHRDISAVYSAYRIPPSLRMHMLRVAAVAAMVCEKWSGPGINRNDIILTSLIHDIGNIVKGNYDRFPALYPEQWADLKYWKAVQEVTAKRYGDTDQEATLNIAKELNVSDRVLYLLERKVFLRNEETLGSDDWDLKICAYADQRVAPRAVMSILERLVEAKERYRGVVHASVNSPRFQILTDCAERIEKQISQHLKIRTDQINDATTEPYIEKLRGYLMPANARTATET